MPSVPLQTALQKTFFPYVEALGFIRDERQGPQLICFRRKTSSAMQVFAVLLARRGHPGFHIQFTEAPLDGFNYGGSHLAAEDVFPGNFGLLRGWLVPQRGKVWFRLEQPLWRRLLLKHPADPSQLVGQLRDVFPEVLAWWEDKTKREHLRIFPPVPPRPVPTHRSVSGIPIKPSLLQRFFAHEYVWTVSFFGTAVGVALVLAVQAPDLPQMFALVLAGAGVGLFVSMVLFKITWFVRIWINGGPFREGDLVQVITGAHAGKIAAVYEAWPSRSQVRIDLGELECKTVKDVFGYVELCRVKAVPSVRLQNPPKLA